jgi:hypothetical protein
VQVSVKPWADVRLDGQAVGTTPMDALTLLPGVHVFQFNHPDYQPVMRKLTLRPGQESRLSVDFELVGVPKP